MEAPFPQPSRGQPWVGRPALRGRESRGSISQRSPHTTPKCQPLCQPESEIGLHEPKDSTNEQPPALSASTCGARRRIEKAIENPGLCAKAPAREHRGSSFTKRPTVLV